MKKTTQYSKGMLILAWLMFAMGIFSTSWLAPMLSSIFLALVAIFLLILTIEHDGRR